MPELLGKPNVNSSLLPALPSLGGLLSRGRDPSKLSYNQDK